MLLGRALQSEWASFGWGHSTKRQPAQPARGGRGSTRDGSCPLCPYSSIANEARLAHILTSIWVAWANPDLVNRKLLLPRKN